MPPTRPYLPDTAEALAEMLGQRFGAAIARAAVGCLELDPGVRLEMSLVERAVEMALDAELAMVGVGFVNDAGVSALANSPGFRRAAAQAGVPADALNVLQRLQIDAAYARRRAGCDACASDLQQAVSMMAAVMLDESI